MEMVKFNNGNHPPCDLMGVNMLEASQNNRVVSASTHNAFSLVD